MSRVGTKQGEKGCIQDRDVAHVDVGLNTRGNDSIPTSEGEYQTRPELAPGALEVAPAPKKLMRGVIEPLTNRCVAAIYWFGRRRWELKFELDTEHNKRRGGGADSAKRRKCRDHDADSSKRRGRRGRGQKKAGRRKDLGKRKGERWTNKGSAAAAAVHPNL